MAPSRPSSRPSSPAPYGFSAPPPLPGGPALSGEPSKFVQRLKREAALDTTCEKGRQLVAGGMVVSCDAEPSAIAGTVNLSGLVKGSRGSYSVRVTLDLDDEDVVHYGCDCPAAASYDGMCKHEVALALYYLNGVGAGVGSAGSFGAGATDPDDPVWPAWPGTPTSPAGFSPAGFSPAPASRKRGRTPASQIPRSTSPQVASLLGSLAAAQVDEAAEARHARSQRRTSLDEPPVELLASLVPSADTCYYDDPTWCLKLKVRRGKASYVVKNMGDLVRAYRTGAELSYGKNLSFVHTPRAFDERARALLAVVTRVADSQQALFDSRYKYWDAGRGTDVKELPLSAADLCDVLDALQGSEVEVDFSAGTPARYDAYAGSKAALKRVRVEQAGPATGGDPLVPARLETTADGGCDLYLSPSVRCFFDDASQRLYLLDRVAAQRCTPEFAAQAGPLLAALLPARGPLHVARQDLPDFCRTALPVLRACTDLAVPAAIEALVPPQPAFRFKVGLENDAVFCEATVSYGNWTAGIYEPRRPGQPARDLAAEYRAQDAVEEYFPAGDPARPGFDESDDELLFVLLTEGLRELGELGDVELSERLRGMKVHESPRLRVRATVKSGLLDVAVDASGMAPRDLVAYLDSYRRRERFVRLSDGDIVRIGDNARTLGELADGLGVGVEKLVADGGATGLPSNRTLFVDALLKRADRVRMERSAGFRAVVRDVETFADADFEVPASLSDVLRPYQAAGFRWLQTLERLGFGGILADDMGLGKTVQMIAHIVACKEAALAAEKGAGEKGGQAAGAGAIAGGPASAGAVAIAGGPTLIVCPASLVYNWAAELQKFAPQLGSVCVLGTKAQRRGLIAQAAQTDVLVTSYDLMKRDVEEYAAQRFARVVLDEAQYIKNAGTQAAKAAKCLPSNVRFALTGTPVENRLAELWSIFDFLMPGVLGSRDAFAKRFEGPVERGEEGAARKLSCLVAPFILRRRKADVLGDLPEKAESVVFARMEGEQDRLYKASQDLLARQVAHELPDEFKRRKLQVLAELTRLRQICCDPRLCFDNYTGGSAKLDACLELVRSGLDAGHRILVFSQFTSMLELIGQRLAAEKIGYLTLTGSTSKEERARLVARFQAGGDGADVPGGTGGTGGTGARAAGAFPSGAPTGREDVFLISLKAGGVGLNLTAADMVIHYDPWWNLAAQNQATDRAHRIGQTRDVSVFKLIAQGTVEERIVQMQERKRDLAESVLGGDDIASTALTKDDVLALLGGALE